MTKEKIENALLNKHIDKVISFFDETFFDISELKGDKYAKVKELLFIDEEFKLYYNHFSIVFIDRNTEEIFMSFLKEEDITLKIEYKEFHTYIVVYKLYNNHVLSTYL